MKIYRLSIFLILPIALAAVIAALGCDDKKREPPRAFTELKVATVTAGAPTAIELFFVVDRSGAGADQVIMQVETGAGFTSGLTVTMAGPASGSLAEIPGNARAYVIDVANLPDGEYNFSITGSVQADCTVYFARADAPASANTITAPSAGSIVSVGVPVNFVATPGIGGDGIHFWAFQFVNTGEIAGVVRDDATMSQSFASIGNWRAYSWASGIYLSLGVFNLHVVADGAGATTSVTVQ